MENSTIVQKKQFLDENFLLENPRGQELYALYAAPMPIIDYHSHLSPKDISDDRQFENLTQLWLDGDHYKWRAMRTCGVDERFITGKASDWEKFEKWSETAPKTLRNPLYHWTHLELRRPFGIVDRVLNPQTARDIWEECNGKLSMPGFSTRGILHQMNVEVICTTDDPVDNLEFHRKMVGEKKSRVKVFPTFRPDKAMGIENRAAFLRYVGLLSEAENMEICSFTDFLIALRKRHDYFHRVGCRVSDHGIETIYSEDFTETETKVTFAKVMEGGKLNGSEILKFKSAMLHEFALMDWEKGWVQQYHLGALRNNNARMMSLVGPDTGFDSIGDFEIARPLSKFLSKLDNENELAKTILYNLNPRDNEVIATMIGNFQDGSVPGKLQYGSAWWFLDQKDGITRHIETLSTMGILSQFVGMLTDSRSFLSYPRHEYFRRILCNILGDEMKRGLIPDDVKLVGAMIKDICYLNAKRYFNFQSVNEIP